jgi:hypothetical protein
MNNLEALKLKLETLKAEYSIVRDKLLLFGAGFGSSLTFIANIKVINLFSISAGIIGAFSFIGLLINLHKAGKIQIELEKIKGLTNA